MFITISKKDLTESPVILFLLISIFNYHITERNVTSAHLLH